jgi:fatty-acyl-CoA synthase
VVLREGEQVTATDVTDHCRTRLAGFKVPKHVEFVEALRKNASGKLLKRELRATIQSTWE